jgi:hypothetical protein
MSVISRPNTCVPELPVATVMTAITEKQLTPSDPKSHSDELVLSDDYPDGGRTAWLVVFSCLLLNFNILGIIYAYGKSFSLKCMFSFINRK